ncbi:MAG: PLP-dependent aminotransferase family protein [Pseudomonadota bacterium]
MAIWKPELTGRSGPKYLRIVNALAEGIKTGLLQPGTRLPPHRELAYQLGVSPNTTSRAYAEGVARSLITGEVGRGTYVRGPDDGAAAGAPADLHRSASGPIELSRNLPSPGFAADCLAATLAELGASPRLQGLVDYQTEADLGDHAEAGIDWLGRCGLAAERDNVVVTNGAQHGIFCALMAITRPGALLLTEELTYAPVKAMAAHLGLKLKWVSGDEGGLCPDALDAMCTHNAVSALYVTPTLHTPTTITLNSARRDAIAEVCRRHDVFLIEDDVFGPLKPDRPDPIAVRIPERTFFVTSTSKCLAPGLRVGFARAPSSEAVALRSAVNLSTWMTPPLMAEIAARWIRDGTADRLTAAQRTEAVRRQDVARSIFAGQSFRSDRHGLHFWLTLPSDWTAQAFKAEAGHRGVTVTEGAAFAAGPGVVPNAVRLCLSHEPDPRRLQSGLETLRAILGGFPTRSALVL